MVSSSKKEIFHLSIEYQSSQILFTSFITLLVCKSEWHLSMNINYVIDCDYNPIWIGEELMIE